MTSNDYCYISQHPDFMNGNGAFPNDIAVLKLSTAITGWSSVALPTGADETFDWDSCTISGWGINSDGGEYGFTNKIKLKKNNILRTLLTFLRLRTLLIFYNFEHKKCHF